MATFPLSFSTALAISGTTITGEIKCLDANSTQN